MDKPWKMTFKPVSLNDAAHGATEDFWQFLRQCFPNLHLDPEGGAPMTKLAFSVLLPSIRFLIHMEILERWNVICLSYQEALPSLEAKKQSQSDCHRNFLDDLRKHLQESTV